MSGHFDKNRRSWDASSAEYQRQHGEQLTAELAWGVWSVPESELQVLGDLRDRDVLEFGCGGGQWSLFLAKRGVRVVGLDASGAQLAHARRAREQAGLAVPLVHANAERTPLADASFDVVFCDHGAMSFANPDLAVPEAARLLRPGGLLAFNMASVFHDVCWDPATDAVSDRLHANYFELGAIDDGETVSFQRSYGDWIRLFGRCHLEVQDLVEIRPPTGATTTYDFVPFEWARRWPSENIWKLRKAA